MNARGEIEAHADQAVVERNGAAIARHMLAVLLDLRDLAVKMDATLEVLAESERAQ